MTNCAYQNEVDSCKSAILLAIHALGDAYTDRQLPVSKAKRADVQAELAPIQSAIAALKTVSLDEMTLSIAVVLAEYDDVNSR